MPYVLLAAAITSEVVGTICLRYSDGFSRAWPAAGVVVGYAAAFYLLALVLKRLSLGFTYAVWAGLGTAAIAIVGMLAWGEPASPLRIASLLAIIAGVVGLNLAGGH